MPRETLQQHLYSFLMGFLGAVATAAGVAAVNYLGAHIPDLLSFVASTLGGTITTKLAQ